MPVSCFARRFAADGAGWSTLCGYADKHRASGRPVHLIAVEFSRQTRNVAAFEAAPA